MHKKVPGPLKAGDREWSTQKTGPIIMNGMPQALSAIESNTPLLHRVLEHEVFGNTCGVSNGVF